MAAAAAAAGGLSAKLFPIPAALWLLLLVGLAIISALAETSSSMFHAGDGGHYSSSSAHQDRFEAGQPDQAHEHRHQQQDSSLDYYQPSEQMPANNNNNNNNINYDNNSNDPLAAPDSSLLSSSSSGSSGIVDAAKRSNKPFAANYSLPNDLHHHHSDQQGGERENQKAKEYLSHSVADQACKRDRGCERTDRFNNTYLNYCTRYKLENLFSSDIMMSIMHDSTEDCQRILDEFIQLDEVIDRFNVLFIKLLTRYNCHNGYSVKWSCDDCKRAYKDWLCATSLPYYMNGERVKPCISFCERVEQRCPYLHPITKEQYGGQPVFICRDPNIPFVPEITPDIPYSEPMKCYDMCHLTKDINELMNDSLSKYEYDKCPDKDTVAEEVRNDMVYCPVHLGQHPGADAAGHDTSGNDTDTTSNRFDNANTNTDDGNSNQHNNVAGGADIDDEDDDERESTRGKNQGNSNNPAAGDERQHPPNGTAAIPARTTSSSSGSSSGKSISVHVRKLNELKEVLAIYKSQPKTHKFGHHSSSEHRAAFVASGAGGVDSRSPGLVEQLTRFE